MLTAVSDHSGLSANRAGLLNAQSWRLIIVWLEVRVLPAPPRSLTRVSAITVWLEVRVLPAPPRSPTQTEISRFSANSPELAGILAGGADRPHLPVDATVLVALSLLPWPASLDHLAATGA